MNFGKYELYENSHSASSVWCHLGLAVHQTVDFALLVHQAQPLPDSHERATAAPGKVAKTGSTSLQAFMHANRDALQWRGLFYPASPPGDRHILKQRFLFDSVDQAAKGSGDAEFAWTRLAEQIVQRDAPINVISEEVFWHLFEDRPQRRRTAVQWMAKQLAHCDVHIVCYLRRQSDWVESWFNQIVKTDVSQTSRLSFEDFIARQERLGVMDYQQMLAVWAEVFGADRVIVRPWERGKLLRGNIVDDFCDLVGLKDMDDLKRPEDQQSSLSATALEAMLSFNRQPTTDNRPRLRTS